ncbi:MAG TPA: hypothetical protein PL126_06435 [Candidatus Cloacimonadota bacterium]|nr:hypothetical protein [Candidatus Cloacimonadota bacterium]
MSCWIGGDVRFDLADNPVRLGLFTFPPYKYPADPANPVTRSIPPFPGHFKRLDPG